MGEYIITAKKGDIALNFYLGVSQLFYYCSVGIKLSGELGERATPDSKYRNMGVSTIAECLDPEYKFHEKSLKQVKKLNRILKTAKKTY